MAKRHHYLSFLKLYFKVGIERKIYLIVTCSHSLEYYVLPDLNKSTTLVSLSLTKFTLPISDRTILFS